MEPPQGNFLTCVKHIFSYGGGYIYYYTHLPYTYNNIASVRFCISIWRVNGVYVCVISHLCPTRLVVAAV